MSGLASIGGREDGVIPCAGRTLHIFPQSSELALEPGVLSLTSVLHHLIPDCLLEQFGDIDLRMIFEPIALLCGNG